MSFLKFHASTVARFVLAGFCLALAAPPQSLYAAESGPAAVPIPPADAILARLRPQHPRLLASAADFAALRERIPQDQQLQAWQKVVVGEGQALLSAPPSRYEIPDGLRLLATSRRVLDRVTRLAMLYRLNGDRHYADRAWQELDAAANFKDWNPRHFLDTAEMTAAFAIGYDWLYDYWTPSQRETLRRAMVEKGLKPALEVSDGKIRNGWWSKVRHNWNQVCNGGISLGALALADVEPELSGRFLHSALQSIQLAMAEYAPDGAWAEGPGYWAYATTYNVLFLAALQTALGTDFGLAKMPGFSEAGAFPIYASGPTGLSFSYADAHAGIVRAPVLFWLAREFNHPDYARYQRRVAHGDPLDLLWYDARLANAAVPPPPLDKYFRHSEIVTMRSAWEDPNALFVGLKAGDNKANHSHLDLGSFVLDALGQRWAVDLGSDDYNMPGYFGANRWTYYRLRAEGHNTLVLNPGKGPDQDPKAVAPIERFESEAGKTIAIVDLSAAYGGAGRKIERGIAMLERRSVLVQDEISSPQPAEVWWFLHTPAEVELQPDAAGAVLRLGKQKLTAMIVSPKTARFEILPAAPLPGSPNPGMQAKESRIRKLAVHLQDVTALRLAVLLTPVTEDGAPSAAPPHVTPLARW